MKNKGDAEAQDKNKCCKPFILDFAITTWNETLYIFYSFTSFAYKVTHLDTSTKGNPQIIAWCAKNTPMDKDIQPDQAPNSSKKAKILVHRASLRTFDCSQALMSAIDVNSYC